MSKNAKDTAETNEVQTAQTDERRAALERYDHITGKTHPNLIDRLGDWADKHDAAPKALRVTAKVDGFRRAGIEHQGKQVYPFERFTPDQVEMLLAERNLLVEFLASADEATDA